jgi:protein TonB
MFDQTFVTGPAQTRKPWSVAVSLVLQTACAALILILPLLHIAKLQPPERTTLWIPLQAVPQPAKVVSQATKAIPVLRRMAVFTAPRSVPTHIDMTPDLAPPEIGMVIPGGAVTGPLSELGSAFGDQPVIRPPARAAIVKSPAPPAAPVRVSGGAQAARLIFGPKPAYPPLARTARVQGVVKLQAVIGLDGSIKNLQVVSGPPLLVAAAISAVKQWRYQPTLLSGEPVEVATEIEVNFALN